MRRCSFSSSVLARFLPKLVKIIIAEDIADILHTLEGDLSLVLGVLDPMICASSRASCPPP